MLDMIGIQDCGLALNRAAARSQINGGMIQALSYGLLEQRVVDPELGVLLTASMEDYKIAGSLEMPRMVAILDDDDDRTAPIGMAEATVIPGHSAHANAVFNACGARVRDLPITPDKVLAALDRARGAGKGGAR
jgi:xanthine dehydrogenase YagR molybdenum-binding subunit